MASPEKKAAKLQTGRVSGQNKLTARTYLPCSKRLWAEVKSSPVGSPEKASPQEVTRRLKNTPVVDPTSYVGFQIILFGAHGKK